MHPTLFNLGPIPIRSYGFMMIVGFLVATHLGSRLARKCGADEETVVNLSLLSLITGIVGARVFYVIHYLDQFLASDNPLLAMVNLTSGGLEFYGGFLVAVSMVILYTRLKKRSMRWYLDIMAPAIMAGLAFGRIGCLLNGCCWGAPTKSPIAIRFPYGSMAFEEQWGKTRQVKVPAEFIVTTNNGIPFLIDRDTLSMSDDEFQRALAKAGPNSNRGYFLNMVNKNLQIHKTTLAGLRSLAKEMNLKSVPVHPTQIYESILALSISWVLTAYFWRRKRDGMVIAMVFVLYPIGRFLLEMLRADNPQDTFGFTVSQGISLAAIPLALGFMLLLKMLPERSPRAVAELAAKKSAAVARPVKP